MTSPGGRIVARVGVRALPNTSSFKKSLERFLNRMERTLRVELPTVLDTTGLDADLKALKERISRTRPAKIPVEYEQPVRRPIAAPPVEPVPVKLVPQEAPFQARIKAILAEVQKNAAAIPLTAKGEVFRRQVAMQVAAVEKSLRAEIPFDPELAANFRRDLEAKAKAAALGVGGKVHFDVDIDRGLFARLREVASLGKLLGSTFGTAGQAGVSAFSAMSKTVAEFGKNAVEKVTDVAGSLGTVIKGILGVQYVIPGVVTGVTLLGGTAVAAFGAISAGIAGLPVLLTGLLAPIGVVALGIDGLKTAASGLKKPFDDMKAAVTDAFAFDFKPVFDSLYGLVRALGPSLVGIVASMSHFARALADVVNTVEGTRKLETALGGVQLMLDRIRFGAVTVFNAMVNIAGTQNLYRILGDTIGGVAERFGNMLERIRASGDLEAGLSQLQNLLLSIVDMLVVLTEGSIKFFTSAGPGLKAFFDSLTETLSRVDWAGLGQAFGGLMERIGSAIQNVSPETWQKFGDSIGHMADQFITLIESGALQTFIDLVSRAIGLVSGINSVIASIENFLNTASDADDAGPTGSFETSPFYRFITWVGGIGAPLATAAGAVGGFFATVGTTVGGFFANLPETIIGGLSSLGESVSSGLSTAVTKVTDFFANLPYTIGYWIGFLATSMALSFVDLVQGVINIFVGLPVKLGEIAGQAAIAVVTWLITLPATLGGYAQQAYDAVVNWFQQLPGKIALFAADMVGRVTRFFQDLPGQLFDLAGRAVDAVINKIKEMPGKAQDEAGKTVDDIMEKIKELPGRLLQAGKDAISSFIQGIKDKAHELYQAAKDTIFGAIAGGQDALDQHSPSRVFIDMGRGTMDSYMMGLFDRARAAKAQMRALFAGLAQSAAGAAQVDLSRALSVGNPPRVNAAVHSMLADMSRDAQSGSIAPAAAQGGQGGFAGMSPAELTQAFLAALQQAKWAVDGDQLALIADRGRAQLARR